MRKYNDPERRIKRIEGEIKGLERALAREWGNLNRLEEGTYEYAVVERAANKLSRKIDVLEAELLEMEEAL